MTSIYKRKDGKSWRAVIRIKNHPFKGKMTFEASVWREGTFDSDIIDDLYQIAKSINNLSERDSKLIYGPNCLTLEELQAILQKHGYSDSKIISAKMIEICTRQNQRFEEENEKLSQQKISLVKALRLG